jgi:hypothetical protein
MRKTILSFSTGACLILLMGGLAKAQQPVLDWARPTTNPAGSNSDEVAIAQVSDAAGNIYTVGTFNDATDFDPGAGTATLFASGDRDIYIQKLTGAGNFVWAKKVGGIWDDFPADVALDNAGNVLITGGFRNSVDFNSTGGGYTLSASTSIQTPRSFVLKLDASGNFIWVCAAGEGYGRGIDVDAANNIYVSGRTNSGTINFQGTSGSGSITGIPITGGSYIWKLNAAGAHQWVRGLNVNTGDKGLYAEDNGNIYVTGSFDGTRNFNPGGTTSNLTATGSSNAFLTKYDSNGLLQWAKRFGSSVTQATEVTVGGDGSIYLTGYSGGTTDLDPTTGTGTYSFTSLGGLDIFLIKTNSSGIVQWAKAMGSADGDLGMSIAVNAANEVYVTGYFRETIDFDTGAGTANLTASPAGMSDAYLVKYSANGNLVWARNIGSTGEDQGHSVIINVAGDIIAGGTFKSTVDLDPGAGTSNFTANGIYSNAYLIKLHECVSSTATVSVSQCTSYTAADGAVYSVSGTYTATITNARGCDSVITINLAIGDITAPVANIASLPVINSQCAINSLTAPTAADNCAGAITGTHNASFPIASTTLVTWTYDDGNGNTSTQTQNVVINDNTAPVANAASLSNITAQCSVNSLTAPTATDNCAGIITGTHNATFPITASTTVTWTYDDGKGNTSTQTQNVVINDNTAPIADAASLSPVTSQCPVNSLTVPTATDNCAGAIIGTHNATFPITVSTVVTWTYDDGKGNTSTQTQNVVINDNTAPVADVANLSDITAQCSVTSLTVPTATDNCAGAITGTHNASLPITSSATITWTYDDGQGNITTQTQNVVINDNTAPVADVANLSDITAQCSVTSLTAPTATDNCAGVITGTHNASLPITSSTAITWTFDDGEGNLTTQTQNVVINDNTAPIADVANLSDITSQCPVTSLIAPIATDNCTGTITGTQTAILPLTSSTTITWTFDDGHGNTSTQTQDVVVTPIDNSVTASGISLTANANGLDYQWIDCDNGNSPIAGATSQTYTATANGNYAVQISNGSCSVTSACTAITVVGIANYVSAPAFVLFPNPASETVNIDLGKKLSGVASIHNSIGQLIWSESFDTKDQLQLQLNGENGMYYIEIKTADENASRLKVVKSN